MTSMKIFQLLRPPPTPLVHLGSKFFLSLDLGRPISSQSPPLQMITNQSKENVIQGWLLHVIMSFLQVGFRFQCQLIDLIWISFDFFSYNWSLAICFFVALYSWVCSCPRISRNVFYLWLFRARSLVVSDLHSESKGSRFEPGCYLCAEVSTMQ